MKLSDASNAKYEPPLNLQILEAEEEEKGTSSDLSFTVSTEAAGTRLDTYLASQITTTSRSQIGRPLRGPTKIGQCHK